MTIRQRVSLSSLKKKTAKLTPAKKRHERALQEKGVDLVVADCGLFGPFHEDFREYLKIPFMGTALDLVSIIEFYVSGLKLHGFRSHYLNS